MTESPPGDQSFDLQSQLAVGDTARPVFLCPHLHPPRWLFIAPMDFRWMCLCFLSAFPFQRGDLGSASEHCTRNVGTQKAPTSVYGANEQVMETLSSP